MSQQDQLQIYFSLSLYII